MHGYFTVFHNCGLKEGCKPAAYFIFLLYIIFILFYILVFRCGFFLPPLHPSVSGGVDKKTSRTQGGGTHRGFPIPSAPQVSRPGPADQGGSGLRFSRGPDPGGGGGGGTAAPAGARPWARGGGTPC